MENFIKHMYSSKLKTGWLIFVFSLFACGVLQPNKPLEPAKATGPTNLIPISTQTLTQNNLSDYRVQIKVHTTSDWTTVQLVQGNWESLSMVSASKQGQTTSIDGNMLSLRTH